MSDIADDSDVRIQLAIETGIAESRKGLRQLRPIGKCYFCDEPLDKEQRFCPAAESDCRDLYEKEKRMGRITGN